jgi:hypothetical protein
MRRRSTSPPAPTRKSRCQIYQFIMKASSPAAATALAALYAKDGRFVERCIDHLTCSSLRELDRRLHEECSSSCEESSFAEEVAMVEALDAILARACIRRRAHACLDKWTRASKFSREEVEDALRFHVLPPDVRAGLVVDGGIDPPPPPPTNWREALEQLKESSSSSSSSTSSSVDVDRGGLWRLVCDHPMTSYVPAQCKRCGRVVPDQYPPERTDVEVGLEEIDPTGDELELRSGWFRGPRSAVVFRLTCPDCSTVTDWYRSGHPRIMLDPDRHGRLCGEQEDLRMILAGYLNITIRLIVPLDWDHVWTEYEEMSSTSSSSSSSSSPSPAWQVHDGNARNFCRRLDEGIGSWTGIWAVHPDPAHCEDVTREYLTYRRDGGRADDHDGGDMIKYADTVRMARQDPSGESTQSKNVNGYVLSRAGLSAEDITSELKLAAREYGMKGWWQLNDS